MKKLIFGSLVLLAVGLRPILAEEVRTLPQVVYPQMKKGAKLDKVWASPNFDSAKGFVVGKMTSMVDDQYANTIDYFPHALARIVIPESKNVINLSLVWMEVIDRTSTDRCSAAMEVEGQVVDPAGQLLFAFRDKEEVNNRENVKENCRAVMDRMVWKLSKDLGKPFARAIQVKQELVTGPNPSGLAVPEPVKPVGQDDIKGRLLRLEDLRQKGLISPEEYQDHKEEILKGL